MRIREYLVEGVSAINICFSLVKLMGGKGNDPFDHEQKLPEDKQYESWDRLSGCGEYTVKSVLHWYQPGRSMKGQIECVAVFL